MDDLASGLIRTWWRDGDKIGGIVDSAPAATAYSTGFKTNDKFLGMTYDLKPVATVLEGAQALGKSTGLIATSNIQHATPAAFSSHINDRALNTIISSQQVYNNIDVVFGGGSQFLNHKGNDLIEVLKENGYQYITTKAEMEKLESYPVWGMFAPNAMAYDFDRVLHPNEPSLAEMTAKAIELLSQNEKGFFLMVEGSKIDWTAHANDPIGLVSDILAFDDAVGVALEFAKENQDTMLLIMSDHGTGGITMGNRDSQDSRAALPYDNAALIHFIEPLTRATLTAEGVGVKLASPRTNANIIEVVSTYYGIDNLTQREVASIRSTTDLSRTLGLIISERAYLGWTTHGHTGGEVNLFTYLPGDGRITGTLENTEIAEIIAGVWGIDLAALTAEYFVDVCCYFEEKGAELEYDDETGILTVTKGDVTLEIPEFRNYVFLNGEKLVFDSVIVN
jgi:alkaline phosphatase